MKEQIIEAAINYITDLFQDNSGGHDVSHTMRVYRNALAIADSEKKCDMEIVSLAALLA